jgi:tRNA(Ile)-lysidine synthase
VVRRLAGLAASLPSAEQRRLRDLPARARGALPVVQGPDGAVSSPLLSETAGVEVRSLVGERLRAASGLVEREDP